VGQRRGVVVQVPAHGGGQVTRLGVQPPGPFAVAGAAQRPVRPLRQRPVILGVPALDPGEVGPGRQPLGDERTDGLQHPRPGPVVGWVEVDQAVPGQCLRQLQRPVLGQAGDLGRSLDGPAVHEDRHRLKQRPLGVFQQAMAPLDRGPQRVLAFGHARRAGPQRIQRRGQAAQQGAGVQQPGAGGASSIASGSPSSRRQIAATAAAFPAVTVKAGRTARARSTNSATPQDRRRRNERAAVISRVPLRLVMDGDVQ